jgi:predicted small integral membrane protein
MVGTTPSITIAFVAAILLALLGIVVDVIALPAVSATVPIVKLETVKSEDD